VERIARAVTEREHTYQRCKHSHRQRDPMTLDAWKKVIQSGLPVGGALTGAQSGRVTALIERRTASLLKGGEQVHRLLPLACLAQHIDERDANGGAR